ncbi:hypothetical protein OV079_16290 [Nannocystis pusilla]|uniref:Uncharacterized protein n=1 Tax=Nannocystis pusilla TaxID=889268 RepID=A0A9X3EN37_9BACT|nr:hypothetical protein [Nannocystis pusilla]MCY1007088.1 hypothetical protein [Nannocystis pusilla]
MLVGLIELSLLRGAVGDDLVQALELAVRVRPLERAQILAIAGQQEAAQGGLLIDDLEHRRVGLREDFIAVVDPGGVVRHQEDLPAEDDAEQQQEGDRRGDRYGEPLGERRALLVPGEVHPMLLVSAVSEAPRRPLAAAR